MSQPGEIDHSAAFEALGRQVDEGATALLGVLSAYQLYASHPAMQNGETAALLAPVEQRLLEIASQIGERLGYRLVTDDRDTEEIDGVIAVATTQSDTASTTAASAEREKTGVTITSINRHTLQIGDGEYFPIVSSQGLILDILRKANEPLTSPQIHQRIHGVKPGVGGAATFTRDHAKDLAEQLNLAYGTEVIRVFQAGNAFGFEMNKDIQFVDAMPDNHEGLEITQENMYAGILDISVLNLPTERRDTSIVVTILSDSEIVVNGREEKLSGHNLYMFNALLLNRGYATPDELKRHGFQPAKPAKFTAAVSALRTHLNGYGKRTDSLLLTSGGSYNTVYALSARAVFVDERQKEAAGKDTDTGADEGSESGSSTNEAFARLVSKYDEVAELYSHATKDDEPRSIRRVQELIAHATELDLETASTMVLLAHLSKELDRPFGLGELLEPATLEIHTQAVMDRIDNAMSATEFNDPRDKAPTAASQLRRAILGLRLGLPSSLQSLQDMNFPKAEGGRSTYSGAYSWAWGPIRSGSVEHLAVYFGRTEDQINSAYNFARTRLVRTLDQIDQRG